jgi:hypothetical protein
MGWLTGCRDHANFAVRQAGEGRSAPRIGGSMSTKPDDKVETEIETPHVAKVGVIDTGHNVTSFNEEPINGLLADIADGDT